MAPLLLLASTLLASSSAGPRAPQTGVPDLGERIEQAAADGLDADELALLSEEALALARDASSRGAFWRSTSLVAELCRLGPPAAARRPRARALALLARRDSDTLRWSSLVTQAFLPDFARLPRGAWADELAAYERLLDELVAPAASDLSERARAELGFARAFARVAIERRWDWLSEAQRSETVALLATLRARFGSLAAPGSGTSPPETLAQRASAYEYELTRLCFGARAPATAGIDLEGRPLDLADHAGKVVVLDFWTTFCQPCLALVPSTRALLAELADEPVVYLGVCGDEDREAGRATAERTGMTWPNLWDGPRGTDGPAATAWNVNAVGWPTVIVLDRQGRIRGKLHGKEQVEAELPALLAELLGRASRPGGR